jgi:hypothetical protein
MSIDFTTSRNDIPYDDLVPRLAPYGIIGRSEQKDAIFLTDGVEGSIWAYRGNDGTLACLTSYAPNGNCGLVLGAIREAFDTQIAVLTGYKIEHDLAGEPWRGQ